MRIPKLVLYRNNFYYVVLEEHTTDNIKQSYLKMTLGEYTYLTMTGKVKKSTRRFKRLGLLIIDFIFNTVDYNVIKELGNVLVKDNKVAAVEYDERFLVFKENLVDELEVGSDHISLTIADNEIKHKLYTTRTLVEISDENDKFVFVIPKKYLVSVN